MSVPLCYAVGMVIGVMFGFAVGGALLREHAKHRRRLLPAIVVATVALGLAIGFGLQGEFSAIDASSKM